MPTNKNQSKKLYVVKNHVDDSAEVFSTLEQVQEYIANSIHENDYDADDAESDYEVYEVSRRIYFDVEENRSVKVKFIVPS